ncbi:hypothetical protein Tco_0456387 [Tanacetum coccineum]
MKTQSSIRRIQNASYVISKKIYSKNVLEDDKRGPFSKETPIRHRRKELNDEATNEEFEDVLNDTNCTAKMVEENEINGDLNVTLYPNEHSSRGSVMTSDMMEFQDYPHDQPLRITKAMLVEKSYEAEVDAKKFLYQQAKIKWLSDGDKNSNYFHKHFETFLGTSHPVQVLDTDDNLFYRRISNEVVERMIEDVSHAEIKSALFDIDDFKAPDPDGFITTF